jgi:hypothetical protein
VEYYQKESSDLLGAPLMDPTVGYKTDDNFMFLYINYAGLNTRGADIELSSIHTKGPFKWETVLLGSHVQNKVTNYDKVGVASALSYTTNILQTPILNQSLDAIYSLPWYGLNPQNGSPLVYMDGKPVESYSLYINSLKLEDLVYSGVTVPRLHGSIRNNFSYRGISLSTNILWKGGYVFRRNALQYDRLFNQGEGHAEYISRWMKPGDEQQTNVPAMPQGTVGGRDNAYFYSQATIQSGNHIRWQDLQLSYKFRFRKSDITWFGYADNLGIIWKKTKTDRDPDYPTAQFKPVKTYSIGLHVEI